MKKEEEIRLQCLRFAGEILGVCSSGYTLSGYEGVQRLSAEDVIKAANELYQWVTEE
jgi:hypothetical protein